MATVNTQQPGSQQQGNTYGAKDRNKTGDSNIQTSGSITESQGFDGLKDAVKTGAQSLQHGAERSVEGISEYGTQINETYLKPFERAVTSFVRNRPVTSVLIGSSVGFLAARFMQRSPSKRFST